MARRITFTRARLEAIAAPSAGKRAHVYDARTPHLVLSVTSNGAKTFYVYRKVDGRPERIRLGGFPELSVDDARDAADGVNGDVARGKNPAEQRRQARGESTLADVFARYIHDYAKAHKKSWRDDQEQFDRYFGTDDDKADRDEPAPLTSYRNRRLSGFARRDVQAMHAKIGQTAGHYSANRLLALLSKVFSFAADLGFEGANPCKGIKRYREQTRERFIQPDEMPKFLAALDKHIDERIADFFRTLLFTGARRDNVQRMAWADVNFSRRTWTVPGEFSKNGDPLTVVLTDQAIEVLKRRWDKRTEGDVYVFTSYGKTGHVTEPKAAWKQILNRAGITDLRIHDLRRTNGSWQAMAGASLSVIGKSLGHKSQATTAIYARLNMDPVKASVASATAAMVAAAAAMKATQKEVAHAEG